MNNKCHTITDTPIPVEKKPGSTAAGVAPRVVIAGLRAAVVSTCTLVNVYNTQQGTSRKVFKLKEHCELAFAI